MADNDEYVASSLPGFQEDDEVQQSTEMDHVKEKWILKKLTPKHMEVVALLAQGMKQVEVAAICGLTKEYISMLFRQPLIQSAIAEKSSAAQVRLEAAFETAVDVVIETMKTGGPQDKLRAVRLHGELTKRIGRPDPLARSNEVDENRLAAMALRLESLAKGARNGTQTIVDAEFSEVRTGQGGTVQGQEG